MLLELRDSVACCLFFEIHIDLETVYCENTNKVDYKLVFHTFYSNYKVYSCWFVMTFVALIFLSMNWDNIGMFWFRRKLNFVNAKIKNFSYNFRNQIFVQFNYISEISSCWQDFLMLRLLIMFSTSLRLVFLKWKVESSALALI